MNRNKKVIEYRAELKSLTEQKDELVNELNNLVSSTKTENRAFTADEQKKADELVTKIEAIEATIKAEERTRSLDKTQKTEDKQAENRAEAEKKMFENYIRNVVEERADINLTKTDNGAVIPTSIANKILETIKDICPIYKMAEKYTIGGTLTFPVYDETEQKIEMAYAEEFKPLTSTSGKFTSKSLTGFLAGALTKISKSLVNNSQFSLVPYVIRKVAEAVTEWLEKELLNGTDGKIEGLRGVTQEVVAQSSNVIVADDLIDLQETVPDKLQKNCIWLMNKKTRTAIRKLKDNDGNYILNKDATSRWGYTLFGHDVYTSDNMPELGTGAKSIYYGDMTGLYIKLTENPTIEILREKFADEHALGIVTWLEMDAKVIEPQKIAVLKMA